MTDLEMTRLCAEAMGLYLLPAYPPFHVLASGHDWNGLMLSSDGKYLFTQSGAYDPLHDDAQMAALVKKHCLSISADWAGESPDPQNCVWWITGDPVQSSNENLNRAVCECVAKMLAARNSA